MKTNQFNIAEQTADFLLQIKAIKLEPSNPFTWASGWKSPIYCDNRKTLSYPNIRKHLAKSFATIIKEKFSDVEVIAGVATGGIAVGVLVAEILDLPFIYVRSEAKSHGMTNQIEGAYEAGQKMVVIEDLISTGGSSLKAVNALRGADCKVLGMVAIFTYDFEKAVRSFADANCEVYTLSNYATLIERAKETGYVSEDDVARLQEWRKAPDQWK
ncbi:orotate phosphoribosyltransferase [Balneicella halophila]|uniref:Orotate phosphoribosyltransferase n=1 Tax=Balneicella halophila TaxID=1537566 RepID=A0A7L4UPS9_BALHA|nr:orotate phosphoribosyltransferase [Balneicella halophila]PVX50053.1 orotate phosphoribosyltransferase [Balneicella halophila]